MTADATVVRAVLFDRDGTLVADVPGNTDWRRVEPMPTAYDALDQVRGCGLKTAVVTNQSALGRGELAWPQLRRINARVEELLGPLDTWVVCPHDRDFGCRCRKPRPGLVLEAARRLKVRPAECAVIGDIGSDMAAARAAGAVSVLVPTPQTLPEEVAAAPLVAPDLLSAVRTVLGSPA
ncbi:MULTISPECIES: D-glycero-alpha-D-manno-heptose-1,7-bisphosphate 7-phosphatase [Streptomyces]|uniref:D-glycero-alpha-D-manno-heptose-1,7-bisphosphate 7-phosphatase n=1 Tax=Streptomyces TaxID=1883 RepID=UPI002249374E|nr:HAD family hydrolase [Streptomyces sp. JHD 1]MCX2970696.1 HAD family hydrolase [Streptomyces sp. JHD 1]